MKRSVRARWAAPAALLLLAGCYAYVPTELASAPPDQELRVYLSRRALADIPEDIPTGSTFLTGQLVRQTQDSLLLAVPVSRRVEGAGALDLRQNVFVPKSEIVDIQYRQLNRVKTTAALAASVAAGAALVLGVFDASVDQGQNQGESPDQIRIPFFSFPAP
jgi:hypothetical protein